MYDIFLISNDIKYLKKVKERYPFAKLARSIDDAESQSLTSMFWIINDNTDLSLLPNIKLPAWDRKYIHMFGYCQLIPKNNFLSVKFYKGEYTPQYDIFFISYNEESADSNFNSLLERFPRAKRIHGIKGIHNAHKEAAQQSESDYFWVVDADAIITESFNFTMHDVDKDTVYVWYSQNPVNDLVYGYGGVKLLPKNSVLNMDTQSIDMTTSITKKVCVIPVISNITSFNTDPFSTWKSAFRECVKLSSKTINNQLDKETESRLDTWCTSINDKPFSKYAVMGALAGRNYGQENAGNIPALSKINDFEWLKNYFETNSDAIGNISEMTLAQANATS